MQLGADPDQIDVVAATMERSGLTLDIVVRDLDAAADAVVWRGADAERFRQQWRTQLRPAVTGTAAAVRAGATHARRQAAEQRRTSEPGSDALGIVGTGTVGAGERARAGRHAVVPPAPVGVRIMTAELSASAQVLAAGLTIRFRVEDLGGGRSRIVELDRASAGAQAQLDGRAKVSSGEGSTALGSGAVAGLEASVGLERSWLVPTGDVDDFLLSRVVDPRGTSGRSVVGSALAAVPGAGLAAGVFGVGDEYRALGYERPEPERIGIVVGGGGAADADARIDGTQLEVSGALATGVVVAASRSSVDGSISMQMSNQLVASAATGGHGSDVDWSGTTTLTVDRSGTPTSLSTTRTSTDGDRIEQQHGVIDLTTPSMRAAAADLVDAIEAGPSALFSGEERITDALRSIFAAAAGDVATRTDVYSSGGTSSYGIELPVGSAVVTTEHLRLVR